MKESEVISIKRNIFDTSDFMAIRNEDQTYFIVFNRHGKANGRVSKEIFNKELMSSEEPVVLNWKLLLQSNLVKINKGAIMKTYKVFVNGQFQGTIKTKDIELFVKQTYPEVESSINHEKKEVYMKVDILEAMRTAAELGSKVSEVLCSIQ